LRDIVAEKIKDAVAEMQSNNTKESEADRDIRTTYGSPYKTQEPAGSWRP